MGFKSNINYAAYEGLRQRGGQDLTKAKWLKKKEEEAEERRRVAEAKAAATRRSGQRSGLQKLGSAALRAGAAYYTGGASEALGFGGTIDDIVLGTDDQGRSVRNEYGDLVRAGSGIYGAMKSKKAGDVARKRASNISDYNEQVALAKEMGEFDPVLGKDMLQQARDTRYAQKAQTQAGEDASLWGWDNKFDDLALSPAQIAGKEQADLKLAQEQAFEAAPIVSDPMQRRIATGDVTPELADTTIQRYSDDFEDKLVRDRINEKHPEHQSELDRIDALHERDRKTSDLLNIREDAMSGRGYKTDAAVDRQLAEAEKEMSVGKIAEDREWDRLSRADDVDRMMDSEYDKRHYANKGIPYEEELSNQAGMDINRRKNLAAITPYKTYSEKEAEKLSDEDTDKLRAGALDDIAFDTKGRALEKRGGFLRAYDRLLNPKQGREDEQHFREYMLRQKAELAREHARTGGPEGGERFGSLRRRGQRPESTLLRRIKARRKGSILHGD